MQDSQGRKSEACPEALQMSDILEAISESTTNEEKSWKKQNSFFKNYNY